MTAQLHKSISEAAKTKIGISGRRNRHVIDLSQPRQQEKSVSKAFKIWMGAYALVMLAGLSVAASPARSQTIENTLATFNKTEQIDTRNIQSGAESQPASLNANLIILGGIVSLFAAGGLMVLNTRRKAG